MVKIPGVGKKTAERLIIEMRDKIDTVPVAAGGKRVTIEASPKNEAVDALIALGFKAKDVNALVDKLEIDDHSAEDIIRMALKQVAR